MKPTWLLICLLAINHMYAQQPLPYKNPALPIAQRVNDLLARMTPEEKFWQLFMIPGDPQTLDRELKPGDTAAKYYHGIFGLQLNAGGNTDAAGQLLQYKAGATAAEMARTANRIQRYFVNHTRLGIPLIFFDEALHGLVQKDATVFPQAIALAATWDTALMGRVATAIMHETKSRGIRQILSPVVNIADDVRWGRVEETYGEDPFLAAQMGVAFVRPFEQNGIITTPKHFIANNGSGGRDSYPVHWSDQLMQELYLPPFLACIVQGGSRSVMTAYNSVNGRPATASTPLLKKLLKQQPGFTGFIISDAAAVGGANVLHYTATDYEDASAQSINNGLDVIFQTAHEHHKLFMPPFLDGRVHQQDMDDAVRRVLTAKMQLGLFENPYVSSEALAKDNVAAAVLAGEAAAASAVLLKNEGATLPLSKNIRSMAVIGTDAVEARPGGYSGPGTGNPVSVLKGLQEKLAGSVQVRYAPGPGRHSPEWEAVPGKYFSTVINGQTVNGLLAEYFDNIHLAGAPAASRVDEAINFRWTLYPPHPALRFGFYSARFTGQLQAPLTGRYKIGIEGTDGYRLYINGRLLVDNWKKQSFSTLLADYDFVKGRKYDIRVEFFESSGHAWLKLVWNSGVKNEWRKQIQEAVQLARGSDVAVIVAGIEEGEGRDRASLSLPGHQEELIEAVAATGKPVVVLLVGGSAITMRRWLPKVQSVMQIWYPGEKGGHAVAHLLTGAVNPSGKLPFTVPITEGQLPLVYHHKPTGRNDDYNDLSGLPLFPFGYGLSYTTFAYSNLQMERPVMGTTESTALSFTLRNTGPVAGAEVVQLYLRDEIASLAQPVKLLKGFQKIYLQPGESRTVRFTITPEMLRMLNAEGKWVVEPGKFVVMVGAGSADVRLRGEVEVK